MESISHFSHHHSLVFSKEPSHEDDEKAYCSGCGEVITGPRFSCLTCGFHLDKVCAEAPFEISHPFHYKHNFSLLVSSSYSAGMMCFCDFCGKNCDKFVYHCSCNIDFHVKCTLFLLNITKKKNGDHLQHIAQKDPSISTENHSTKLKEIKCFICWRPLLESTYLFVDSRFYLHKKCIELPLEINHLRHPPHPLILQFNSDRLSCQICLESQSSGLVYSCPPCKFVIQIDCESLSLITKAITSHEHPFTRLVLRRLSFTCDACGFPGNSVSYACSPCKIIVHRRCTSLPGIIKSIWHSHPIFHKYFLLHNECETRECLLCHKIVNIECGSYHCSKCKFILHVHCALEYIDSFYIIESINEYENARLEADAMDPSFDVIQWIKRGENVINTEIKHFSHQHNLVLDEEVQGYMCCNGCSELIESSFYCCLQCDFFLHKSCAELHRKKEIWTHFHERPFNLVQRFFFECGWCGFKCTGFAYICGEYSCGMCCCIRCAKLSQFYTSQAHKHPLLFYHFYSGQCNACGGVINSISYRCNGCDFNVHVGCTFLPQRANFHICDEHALTLRYHEDNKYREYLHCDICEKERNLNHWFYRCDICDTSAHFKCVLGHHPYIKLGTKGFIEDLHRHPLMFVQKHHNHPKCFECGKLCLDLALECAETTCIYIVHWKCTPYSSARRP